MKSVSLKQRLARKRSSKKQWVYRESVSKQGRNFAKEYVAAASCCGQVLWIQNQMLDYGFNFMNIKIYIDNESTICIVKNPVYHSKTKHIAIRHHFIRDAYEKKLIQVLKIHTDDSIADLLTKAFDVSRESLRRVFDGTEALLLSTLFILWLATVSTDSAKLVPLGKVYTAIETLKKNTAKDSLPNQAIFDAIQLIGHLDAKKKFVMYLRFISIFLDKQLANVPVPLDHFPVNALTSKVFSFMVKKGKHFSGKVTPLFASMLVQPTADEGASSERPSEAQPTPSPIHTSEVPLVPQTDPSPIHTSEVPLVPQTNPSPTHTSEVPVEPQTDPSSRTSPFTTIPDSIPESSGGNLGGHSSSDKSLSGNEGEMTLQSVYDLCLSLCAQSIDEECLLEAKISKKEILKETMGVQRVCIQTREEFCQRGVTRDVVDEEKENDEDVLSTKDVLSTAQQKVNTDGSKVSTDRPIVSTDGSKVSTDRQKDSTDEQNEGTDDKIEGTDEQSKGTDDHTEEGSATQTTQPPTFTIFGDDEDNTSAYSQDPLLTLKPLLKIDPKDKGKKKIEEEDESESESDGIPEAKKKFKQLASDEEMARKVQEEWEGEEERKRLDEEEATNEALIRNYDDIKARIEADRLLAEKLQEEEREQFTIKESSKNSLLHNSLLAA
ncbi:hypothetical protein Tco_0725616 [Tanacetum coccineum]|uniref:Uncharacterized protein n=1 Tax=Tanacetum coccineum TaxID=301880 RepID=A0ABQ4YDC8_9ASTR